MSGVVASRPLEYFAIAACQLEFQEGSRSTRGADAASLACFGHVNSEAFMHSPQYFLMSLYCGSLSLLFVFALHACPGLFLHTNKSASPVYQLLAHWGSGAPEGIQNGPAHPLSL